MIKIMINVNDSDVNNNDHDNVSDKDNNNNDNTSTEWLFICVGLRTIEYLHVFQSGKKNCAPLAPLSGSAAYS